LAEKEWSDVEGYAHAKTAVIEEILARTALKSFHEKAGERQVFLFVFSSSCCFFFKLFPMSQAASVATLPSALLLSDCRSVQGGCT
jgi:hypothetical protein